MAVTYDFQTPGVSTSAADTQEDIRNIAEMSWVWHVNASQHSLTNKPTGLIEAFYDSTVDFTSSIPAYGYQNYYSLKAYDGTNLGNVNFMQLYVHNDGAVLSNTVGTRGQEFISMGATAGYSCQSLAPWTINADVGNSGTTTYDPILAFQNQSVERARIYTDTSDSHKLKFDVGGSDQMVIDSSGNVGIGTSSPNASLDVVGQVKTRLDQYNVRLANAANTSGMFLSTNSSGDAFSVQNNAGTTRLHIDNGGNVGIGTSSPAGIIEASDTNARVYITSDSSNNSTLTFRNSSYYWNTLLSGATGSYSLYNGSVRMSIDSSGNVEVNTGNLVIGTSGKGIDFSATSGSGTSELLDDYEEGTFTPTLTTNGTDFTSVGYSVATKGRYTKIGNTVHVYIRLATDSVNKGSGAGAATGNVAIGGLPFTCNSDIYLNYSVSVLTQNWSANPPAGAQVIHNTKLIYLYQNQGSTGSITGTSVSDVGTGTGNNDVTIVGTYRV